MKDWEIIAESPRCRLELGLRLNDWLQTRIAAEKRFVLRADEKLTVFVELESAIRVVTATSAQSAV